MSNIWSLLFRFRRASAAGNAARSLPVYSFLPQTGGEPVPFKSHILVGVGKCGLCEKPSASEIIGRLPTDQTDVVLIDGVIVVQRSLPCL